METKGLQSALIRGVTEGKRLAITYHGEKRLVEVHAVGVSTKGNPCARVYQVAGGAVFSDTKGWKMLVTSDIEEFELLEEVSQAPRDGYSQGDRGMVSIIAEV